MASLRICTAHLHLHRCRPSSQLPQMTWLTTSYCTVRQAKIDGRCPPQSALPAIQCKQFMLPIWGKLLPCRVASKMLWQGLVARLT